MRTRTKYITIIIAAWILLFSIIFFVSEMIISSGFTVLEQRLAVDNSKRVYHVLLSSINYLYSINLDNAYWDDTYEFVEDRNAEYIKNNFASDIFVDNKINYVLVLDNQGKIIFEKAYDYLKKESIPFNPELLEYFKKNANTILQNKSSYNDLAHEQHGLAGFLSLPNSDSIAYFALNPVFDSKEVKPKRGALIYGKIITPDYEKQLSQKLAYPIDLIPLPLFLKMENADIILKHLYASPDFLYIVPLNKDYLMSYTLIRDFNFKPVAVLKVKFSREIHNESQKSTHSSQMLLLFFSIMGILSMSYLVYSFFKQQDLITLAFEQFVPHKLLQLLSKKNILEITLGDYSKRTISILFMDIRNFTTISEQLTPKENFDFINKILNKIAPLISANNGFIDKYIGDAIMALFTDTETHADDATRTATQILIVLDELNKSGVLHTKDEVHVGIGINSGESTLGIIGAEGRLEGTVISDTVNLASRIQSLTKTYNQAILISGQCYECMHHPEYYQIEYVDEVQVKGKTKKTKIYSLVNNSSGG